MVRFAFIICVLFATACASVKVATTVQLNNRHILFNKVKVKIRLPQGNKYTCNGYISMVKDSLICFRFFGPLSYELVSGKIDQDLEVYDAINKQLYEDGFSLIRSKIGLNMSRGTLQALFLADFSTLKQELSLINPLKIQYDSTAKSKTLIIEDGNSTHTRITASLVGQIPRRIVIESKDLTGMYTIELDFLLISNDKRKCNFNY